MSMVPSTTTTPIIPHNAAGNAPNRRPNAASGVEPTRRCDGDSTAANTLDTCVRGVMGRTPNDELRGLPPDDGGLDALASSMRANARINPGDRDPGALTTPVPFPPAAPGSFIESGMMTTGSNEPESRRDPLGD
eukprot:GABV01010516.1.p2 GENE.GABV01010516.1~~GABV01010516.1.p2  ORF type:complete len:134 (-),score=34.02 GABV01010516.1:35-436(-)